MITRRVFPPTPNSATQSAINKLYEHFCQTNPTYVKASLELVSVVNGMGGIVTFLDGGDPKVRFKSQADEVTFILKYS